MAFAIALAFGAAALWRAGAPAHRQESAVPPSSPASGSARLDALPERVARAEAMGPPGTTTASPTLVADLDEPTLMIRLRSVAQTDPTLAVELAREGDRRFSDDPDAPERALLLIHALARLGRGSEARGEAESVVNDYPDSPWIREIEQFTGAHRHRNVRGLVDGGVEFY
jgi:hypothetical protein